MAVNDSDGKAISDLFIRTGRVQYCVMALVLSGFFLFGKQFIQFWAGDGYEDAYIIALLFFVPLTVPLIQNLGITILQARNQMKFRSLLYLVISLVSLGAQIPLAKYYGGIGCACAVAGALILGQIIVMNVYYCVKQKIDIVRFWIEIFKMSLTPAALTVVTYYIIARSNIDSVAKLVCAIALYLVVYLPLFFVFSMNSYERELILNPLKKMLRKA
jgi:O-antigen/teichoic acid export membrane protein